MSSGQTGGRRAPPRREPAGPQPSGRGVPTQGDLLGRGQVGNHKAPPRQESAGGRPNQGTRGLDRANRPPTEQDSEASKRRDRKRTKQGTRNRSRRIQNEEAQGATGKRGAAGRT